MYYIHAVRGTRCAVRDEPENHIHRICYMRYRIQTVTKTERTQSE